LGFLVSSLSLALVDRGWVASSSPGQPYMLSRGGEHVVPADLVSNLADGSLSSEAWLAECDRLGVAEAPVSPLGL
jgi:hypothetical protein